MQEVLRFSPVELDFLWEALGAGELPYPLTLRSHGETMDERAALRRRTMAELAARNLVSMDARLAPDLEDLFLVLARAQVSIDAIFVRELGGQAESVFAGRVGNQAVLAVERPDGLLLRPVAVDSMVADVVAQLPAAPRGAEISVSLPVEEFHPRRVLAGGSTDSERKTRRTAHRLMTEPNLRGGQFGVNSRSHLGTLRRSPVLAWYDKPSGRYFSYVGGGWQTMAPADSGALRQRLGEMVSAITDR